MTDSMNFGPEWLRNLSSDGSTGGGTGGIRYQLAEYRYGREDMLALFDKSLRPPNSLCSFTTLYSEQPLLPLAFQTSSEEERVWQSRAPPGGVSRGRGGSLERGRGGRGRGSYQTYGRSGGFETGGGWGNSEQSDWSPRKDYNSRSSSVDNWRRNRGDEEEGWRSSNTRISEKWGRQTSWRDGDTNDDRGPQDRNRGWHDGSRSNVQRRIWDDDNLPEWATENLGEGGGTFDASGAFHGSDDELVENKSIETEKKESPLQKSSSQQNIIQKKHPATLPSSKSSVSLSKPTEEQKREIENIIDTSEKEPPESAKTVEVKEELLIDIDKEEPVTKEKSDHLLTDAHNIVNDTSVNNRVDEDFDRLQEDLVLKLVEEPSKSPHINNPSQIEVGMSTQPPPNLAPPVQEKWFYQDPQGDLQGPFSSAEMAEWFRAGYFTVTLLVRRQCDERFCMLGDLVSLCNGNNPFQSSLRVAPLKHDTNDLLKLQLMQQIALRQASSRVYPQGEPWTGIPPIQQREIITQQMLTQPQQMPTEMQYIPPQNPLLQMFQMNQTNKNIPEKPPSNSLPIDPIQALVQQMGGLQTMQNRLPTNVGLPGNSTIPPTSVLPSNNVLPVTNNIPGNSNLSTNPPLSGIGLPSNLKNDSIPQTLPALHNPLPQSNMPMSNLQNIPGGLSGNLQNSLPTKNSHTNVDTLNDNNPINNLLRQFANKSQTQSRDSLWQQNQFVPSQINSQWQQQTQDVPKSMWDIRPPLDSNLTLSNNANTTSSEDNIKHKDSTKSRETDENKEEKKKKEQEEKAAAKKELEEKKKQELKKQEAEKKATEEKRKRNEERIKKELEKAKKEAEEKRLRELEEKRKLKEQRKAEEEARKKAEEIKKIEEQERREAKEKEEMLRKQMEAAKHENQIKLTKAAPWCQSNNTHGASLAEIQKAEREKRAEQAALLQKVKQEQEIIVEKPFNSQFSWANKPIVPRQVKSLAEIQAEEQEKLAKVAEARLAQQQKEKETPPTISHGIWNGQNLTWANNTSQWSNSGFWDGTLSEKVANNKNSTVQKSNSTSTTVVQQQQQQKQTQKQPSKSKVKKEQEVVKTLNNNNNSVNDEFLNWCTKSLTALKTSVDIPTFVNFLRDIESALDVREYCRDYLGDSPATHQFASQFLEKRRSFKPKINAHKDDMCSPAPAITPSNHSDFQEVKTKGKKTKKSKMLKVDSRILGFNVTASHDRINVGDRDYVDN